MDNHECALTVRFGRFLLDSHRGELLADGVPVPIGSRAFDVLVVLVEARGRLVTKDELLSRAWPGRFVEENCLQFHISALRKALGPDRDFIKTIAGRGYRFIADVSMPHGMDVTSCRQSGGSTAPAGSPAAPYDLLGHETKVAGLEELVAAHRQAARSGAAGADATRPGIEAEPRSLAELVKAWIAAPGRPPQPELLFPAIAALLQLAEDGPVALESIRMAFVPERLLLLLSIGAWALGRQDCASPLQERLAA
jgi:DNA-binding winged helix-turn-helix (wHTH) protein